MNIQRQVGSTPFRSLFFSICALGLTNCAPLDPVANQCSGTEQTSTRKFLQQVTHNSVIVKWRGDGGAACVGEDASELDIYVSASAEDSHHVAHVEGLKADTVYYYSVGGASAAPEGQQFRTAPKPGDTPADGNTHIWLIGDSGTATEQFRGHFSHTGEALAVKEGFLKYNAEQAGSEPLDMLLLLGDNAYVEGTDAQWQGAFFDVYPKIIGSTPTWPTIGNHEMGAAPLDICLLAKMPACEKGPVVMPIGGLSQSSDPASYDSGGDGPDVGGLPYLDIFSLPSKGESGGVPSGTEQYYSFDHGNVHVVSLDSQLSNRDPAQRAAMREWLIDDLNHNALDWTIVIFHHPPYTKGENHDSDLEQAEIDMRETFAPVFEDHGVDVIYGGHAHSYERSWYINGHHGKSPSFEAEQHAELNSDGEPSLGQGEDHYQQISPSSGSDDKAVYTVAGSAGKADQEHPCEDEGQMFGCTRKDWLLHPAHRTFDETIEGAKPHGLARRGSVVVDATADTLTSRFVDEHGEVLDHFVITR